MKLFELVYLLLAEGRVSTQLGAAKTLGISLSTVSHALGPLRVMGAVRVWARGMRMEDGRKLLLYWASVHRQKIAYQTNVPSVREAENGVPPETLFTSFTAVRRLLKKAPSDYSEVYAYADGETLREIRLRFPPSKRKPNLFVLEAPPQLAALSGKGCVPLSLAFVDLWNNREWYAKEFADAAEREMLG